MEEKQNCSETLTKNTSPAVKRRTNLSTLSNVLKTQTSSVQHRAWPKVPKATSRGSLKLFLLKALISGGLIYTTSVLGIWGEAEESAKAYARIKQAICEANNEKSDCSRKFISDSVKADLFKKVNYSAQFIKEHLTTLPDDMKFCYKKSEKLVNDFMKGKKS